jgi:putative transposase
VFPSRVVNAISHKFFVETAQLRKGLKKMSEQFSMDTLEKLDQFIDTNSEPREIKRALAVQMLAQGVKRTKIQEILGISEAFISKWKVRYAWEGLEGLKLKHQGSQGYLSKRDRAEVIHWLEQKTQVHFSDLKNHLEDCYGVELKSKQSYYDLLKEAGMSWKKTQKKIPNEMIPWWRKDTTKSVIC